MMEFNKYMQEVEAVEDVIETLQNAIDGKGPYYKSVGNIVTPISREEYLNEIIEWAINQLGGNVGYVFMNVGASEEEMEV